MKVWLCFRIGPGRTCYHLMDHQLTLPYQAHRIPGWDGPLPWWNITAMLNQLRCRRGEIGIDKEVDVRMRCDFYVLWPQGCFLSLSDSAPPMNLNLHLEFLLVVSLVGHWGNNYCLPREKWSTFLDRYLHPDIVLELALELKLDPSFSPLTLTWSAATWEAAKSRICGHLFSLNMPNSDEFSYCN